MSSGGGGTNTVQTQSGPPQSFIDAYNQVFGQAKDVASTQNAQYPGQTVAGLSPDQSAGITGVENAYGMSAPYINSAAQYINNSTTPLAPGVQPYVDQAAGYYGDQAGYASQAAGLYGGLTNGLSQDQIQRYQSPYTQDVVNATQAQFNNQNAIQQNQLAGQAGTSGAFGGDRQGVAAGVLGGQQQLAQAPVIAGLENQGYAQALQEANQQQQVQAGAAQGLLGAGAGTGAAGAGVLGASGQLLGANEANSWLNSQAGYGMANLGNAAQQSALTGSNALLGVGGLEQQQAQSLLNVPYQQYLAQQAYPFQSTGWLANIAEGLGGASGGNSSTTSPGPSVGSQIAGAGLAGAGILGQTNAFGSANNPGWLSGIFGSTGGAGTTTATTDALGNAIGDGIAIARGGMVPRRAPGGALVSDAPPAGISPPVSSASPYGMSLPDAQISVVPGAGTQMGDVSGHTGHNLLNTSTGSTSTTTGGPKGDSTIGSLLKLAGGIAAGVYGGPAGALAANALSSQVHFARGGGMQPVNDNWSGGWSEPRQHRASGGTTQVTIVPGSYAGSPGVPQLSMAPATSLTPAAAGPGNPGVTPAMGAAALSSNPSVQTYLGNTLGGASFAPPPVFHTPAPAAAPSSSLSAGDQALKDALANFLTPGMTNTPGNPSGNEAGGGNRDGGRLAHRADGGTYGGDDMSPSDDPDMHGMAPVVPGQTDNPWDISGGTPHGMETSRSMGAPNGPPPPPPPAGSSGMQGPITAGAGAKASPAPSGSSPWSMLTDVGLGIMGGTSPNALTNIGRGALQGLKQADVEKQANAATAYRQQALNETGRHNLVDEQTAASQLSDRATKMLADIKARDAQLGLQGQTLDETKREHDMQAQQHEATLAEAKRQHDIQAGLTGGFGNTSSTGAAVHGDDYLRTLDPKVADQVKAIGDGRMAFPTGFALKTPYWQNMLSAVAQYDPNFDAVNYNARAATRKDFTSGQAAKNVSSLNTVMGHLAAVKDAGEALQNGSLPAVNTAVNWIKSQTGNASVNNFQTAADAVADELEKSFRGSAGAVTGIRNWRDRLSSSASPEQQKGAWKTLTELLDSRIDAMGDQYSRGMGKTTDGLTLLAPHAQEAYQHITGRAPNIPTFSETGQKSQSQPAQGGGQGAIPSWVKPGDQYSPSRGQARSANGTIYGPP